MSRDLELARSVHDGTLDWLCPKMELRACPSYTETVITGCGVIRADKQGRLRFRLSGQVPFPIPAQLQQKRPPGEVYDIEDHVMLVVLDAEGREWRSDPLLIHLNHPGEIMHGYVARPLGSLLHARNWTKGEHETVRMFIPRQSRVPFDRHTSLTRKAGEELVSGGWAIDHHTRRFGDAEVTFREEDKSWLVVTAKQSSPLMPDWPGLMCHALEFATAGLVQPAVIARTVGDREYVGVLSGPFVPYRTNLPRPIVGLTPEDAADFWGLVERFFTFVWDRRDRLPQMLDELAAIRAGAAMSFQTACLTLAIGVEAFARELLPAAPPPAWNGDALQQLVDHIGTWSGDEATKRRVLGLLRGRAEPRAVDRMYAWADATGVPKSLIDSWKTLRHPSAHGAAVRLDQAQFDTYYAVVELMYRIVATAIRYAGPILETSQPGWGQRPEWPAANSGDSGGGIAPTASATGDDDTSAGGR